MDIGDLGFLIIAFIVFIVNFIVKSNKEKIEAQAQEQKKKTAIPNLPELEPWEEEYAMPPFFDTPTLPKKSVESDKKVSKPYLISDSLRNMDKRIQPAQEGMSSLSESLFKEDNMDSISYQDEDSGQGEASYTNELFYGDITQELKKAIIYSEILHRKYE